jgi:aminoglycoside phosphotransferase family enzyme
MYPPPQELRSLRAENARADHQKDSFTPYAELKETHASVVFLVGARAFKLKKPVNLGFLDQSTREKRLAACRRELDLNRRLAPDVYLGISDVLGIDGLPADHLLVMRRMPAQRRLAHLVRSGAELSDDLQELARNIAIFHRRCARNAQVSACGTVDAVRRRWQANFEEAWPFVGVQLDSDAYDDIRSLAENYLRGRGPLFAERIGIGAIVDGHGDLLAEDVFCLPDGPRILDCLEFDSALRYLDRIDDVACLAMDLERLGDPDAARLFLDTYLSISGDRPPASLISHYLAYRAFVRAKVACLPGAAETGGVGPTSCSSWPVDTSTRRRCRSCCSAVRRAPASRRCRGPWPRRWVSACCPATRCARSLLGCRRQRRQRPRSARGSTPRRGPRGPTRSCWFGPGAS